MTTSEILTQIQKKKSFLCIGLDVDLNKIPSFLLEKEEPIFEFNKAIIDATHHLQYASIFGGIIELLQKSPQRNTDIKIFDYTKK